MAGSATPIWAARVSRSRRRNVRARDGRYWSVISAPRSARRLFDPTGWPCRDANVGVMAGRKGAHTTGERPQPAVPPGVLRHGNVWVPPPPGPRLAAPLLVPG